MTIKLYSPLTGDFYENEIDGDGWINTAQEPFLLSGADLAQYKDSIDSLLNRYLDGDKNLMDYFDEERNSSLKEKVTSAVPSVEIRERDLWGCTTVKLTSPLTDTEQKDLQDYLIGQFADGWGEGFEQREIEVDGGTLYVHFWNPDNFTFELGPIEPQEKEPEIIKQVQRPKMRLYGQDGNIFFHSRQGCTTAAGKRAGRAGEGDDEPRVPCRQLRQGPAYHQRICGDRTDAPF